MTRISPSNKLSEFHFILKLCLHFQSQIMIFLIKNLNCSLKSSDTRVLRRKQREAPIELYLKVFNFERKAAKGIRQLFCS